MVQPILLVTGTSTGIGLATAVAAARAGFRVVATMRDTAKGGLLHAAAREAEVELDIRTLDVTDAGSVTSCIDAVMTQYGRLDAVVNNAGAGHLGTIEGETLDDVRAVMEVNFFGVVTVTKATLPHLRETGGRLVTISSVGGVVGQPFNEAYCAAKFAVEGFMESLTPLAATLGVPVSIVEPGAVSTEFVANVGVDVPAMLEAIGPYGPALEAYLARTAAAFDPSRAQTPDAVATAIVDLLLSEHPPARLQTSETARQFVGAKLADLDGSAVQGMTSGWVR
ncbi:SDR family oxidoreductase [Diaminobutyricibacter sp. McL0608]|uniref:SDR family oxidoreductase n=1 Tax=Leifsonia sp. McL0608 TaxID=3143537 RepID=UPI0031F314E3